MNHRLSYENESPEKASLGRRVELQDYLIRNFIIERTGKTREELGNEAGEIISKWINLYADDAGSIFEALEEEGKAFDSDAYDNMKTELEKVYEAKPLEIKLPEEVN